MELSRFTGPGFCLIYNEGKRRALIEVNAGEHLTTPFSLVTGETAEDCEKQADELGLSALPTAAEMTVAWLTARRDAIDAELAKPELAGLVGRDSVKPR